MSEKTHGETHKPDWDATLLRCLLYLLVLNGPFLGLYKAAATGVLQPDQYPFLAAGLVSLAVSVFFCRRFIGIRYGWNETHVFKQGVFKYTEIPWGEIRRIYETGIAQEWTEGDMLFVRSKQSGKRVFVIKSADRKIALEFYHPMVGFKRRLADRLGLKIGDEYSLAWDFIVNG